MRRRSSRRRVGLAGKIAFASLAFGVLAIAGLWGAHRWTGPDQRPPPGDVAETAVQPAPAVDLGEPNGPETPAGEGAAVMGETAVETEAAVATSAPPAFDGKTEPVPEPLATLPAEPAPPVPAPTDTAVAAIMPPPIAREEAEHDRPLWLRNAVPANWDRHHPAIAIVIDDLGVDRRRSERAIGLPGPLTMAWLPYAHDVERQAAAAHAAGHELLLHMPMEPQGKADPGPGAMLTSLSDKELQRRLDAAFASFEGYIGLNNHMGSRFTEDRRGMELVAAELRRRGLVFLDSLTTGHSIGGSAARDAAIPTAGRDVFIDHDMHPDKVRAALARIEAVARKKGWAIAIGHPHDVTIDALAEWLPTLKERGFTLVPVSAIMKAQH